MQLYYSPPLITTKGQHYLWLHFTSQFAKTVGLEDVFGFSEIRIFNFLTNKKGNLQVKLVNSQSWQGHKDLNPEPTVLEVFPQGLFSLKPQRLFCSIAPLTQI